MIEGKNPRLVFHCHEFRYGNSTDFRGHQGLIRKTVRTFSCQAAAHAGGNHSTFVTVDVESVGCMRGGVQGDTEDVCVPGDGVADPPAVVVSQRRAVGGKHEPVVWMSAQVPNGSPPRRATALAVTRRHGEHDLHPLARRNPLERSVDEV